MLLSERRKTLYARVVHFQLKPETLDQGVSALRERVLPDLEQEAGYRSSQLLVEGETGQVLVISLYDTEEGARLRDELGFRRRMGMLAGFLTDRPRPSFYKVVD